MVTEDHRPGTGERIVGPRGRLVGKVALDHL